MADRYETLYTVNIEDIFESMDNDYWKESRESYEESLVCDEWN